MDSVLPPWIKLTMYKWNGEWKEYNSLDGTLFIPSSRVISFRFDGDQNVYVIEYLDKTSPKNYFAAIVAEEYNSWFDYIRDHGHTIQPMREFINVEIETNPNSGTLLPKLAQNFDELSNKKE